MKHSATLLAVTFSALAACGPGAWAAADTKVPGTSQAFGDWVLHCTKSLKGEEVCAMHERIMAADTKLPVAAFAIARNKDSHELRLAAILPLGLDIPAGVTGKAGDVPLTFTVQTCLRRGCIASTTVDDKLLESLRGSEAFSTTFRLRGVAEAVTIPVSLKGLDAGLKALDAR